MSPKNKSKPFKCPKCKGENSFTGLCTSCTQQAAAKKKLKGIGRTLKPFVLVEDDIVSSYNSMDIESVTRLVESFTTYKALKPKCDACGKECASWSSTYCSECQEILNKPKEVECNCCLETFTVPGLSKNETCTDCFTYINNEQCRHKNWSYSQSFGLGTYHYNTNWNRQTLFGVITMLYIHYEEMNVMGVELIKLVFSSNNSTIKLGGNGAFDLLKSMTAMIKQIPSSDRVQEKHKTGAWTWTFPKSKFETLREMWKAAGWTGDSLIIKHPVGLLDKFIEFGSNYGVQGYYGTNGNYSSVEEAAKAAPSAEGFFYNNAQPAGTAEMPLETVRLKLEAMLESPTSLEKLGPIDLKKFYRKAALKYHPDRNNGDGSMMSELNRLYQTYLQYANIGV